MSYININQHAYIFLIILSLNIIHNVDIYSFKYLEIHDSHVQRNVTGQIRIDARYCYVDADHLELGPLLVYYSICKNVSRIFVRGEGANFNKNNHFKFLLIIEL